MSRPTSEMTASSAQICRDLEWPAGTIIESTDPPERLLITAIGEECVLARLVEEAGQPARDSIECEWILNQRVWTKV